MLFVLAFSNEGEWEYRNADCCVNIDDDSSTSAENFVNFGPKTFDILFIYNSSKVNSDTNRYTVHSTLYNSKKTLHNSRLFAWVGGCTHGQDTHVSDVSTKVNGLIFAKRYGNIVLHNKRL